MPVWGQLWDNTLCAQGEKSMLYPAHSQGDKQEASQPCAVPETETAAT